MEGTLSKDFIEEMLSSTYDISSSTCLLSARRQVIQWTHNFQFSFVAQVCFVDFVALLPLRHCLRDLVQFGDFLQMFVVYFHYVMLRMLPRYFIHFNIQE